MEEATFVKGFHDEDKIKKMSYNPLGQTGLRLSTVSLGTSPLGTHFGTVPLPECVDMVHSALKVGINFIDTSPWYGHGRSEDVLGEALRDVPRSAYYIGTKVGRYEREVENMFDFSAQKTVSSVELSLKKLGLEYVDLIQVHDVEFAEDINQVINETLPALQQIVNEGKARFIGVTSYSLELLQHIVQKSTVKIHTVLSYARNTLLDKTLLDYLPFFQSAGVSVINASPTGVGLLSSSGPQKWLAADQDIRAACSKATEMAQSRGVEIAHLALQSSCQTTGVVTTLLGCNSLDMLLSSIQAALTPPSEQDTSLAQEIEEKCFASLSLRSWDGVERKEYQRKLSETRNGRKETVNYV